MRRRLRRWAKFNVEALLGFAVVTRHPPPLTTAKTVYNSFPRLFSPSSADFLRSLTIGGVICGHRRAAPARRRSMTAEMPPMKRLFREYLSFKTAAAESFF